MFFGFSGLFFEFQKARTRTEGQKDRLRSLNNHLPRWSLTTFTLNSQEKKNFRHTYLHLLYVLKSDKCKCSVKYVSRKKKLSCELTGKIIFPWEFKVNYWFLLTGKGFEQFCFQQKSPEQSCLDIECKK